MYDGLSASSSRAARVSPSFHPQVTLSRGAAAGTLRVEGLAGHNNAVALLDRMI
jgi:hypothetical protein